MNKKTMRTIALLLVILSALLCACNAAPSPEDPQNAENAASGPQSNAPQSSGEPSETGSQKDTLVIAQIQDISTFDPQYGSSISDGMIYNQIFECLLKQTVDGPPELDLAESMDISEDGLIYRFKLREGVKFTNGEELTADDVVFTLERGRESPYMMSYFEPVDSFKEVDRYTVEIYMKAPFSLFVYSLAHNYFSILNREAVEAAGDDITSTPVGTGPYKLQEWVKGEKVILERNEEYHRGADYPLKTVTLLGISDPNTTLIALQSGDVDLVAGVGVAASARQAVLDDENLAMVESSSSMHEFMEFNVTKPPFDDPLVRKALAHAVNKEDVVAMAMEGAAVPTETALPPVAFGYDPAITGYEYDPEKAKAMLAEAGYPNGFDTVITTAQNRVKNAEVLQSQLAAIGVNARIESLDTGGFLNAVGAGNSEIIVMGLIMNYPDAHGMLHESFLSTAPYNWCKYNNPQMDQLLIQARESFDDEERKQCYTKALELLKEECPQVPLFYRTLNLAFNKNLNMPVYPPRGEVVLEELSWK
ncbi:ABC transporter substrate-binding protein [Christensenellaceae bacterium OttesenSCG-928-M15]|nr:ABC transporter substrate-binding protein [Christensenellaceae bacterium OttesenSCG-928-M15]